MPDITYKFIGDDQLTPVINQVKSSMAGLASQSVKGPGPAAGGGFKQAADEVKIFDSVASQATKSAEEVAAATARWRAEMGMVALGAQTAAKATLTWGEVQAQAASKMGALTRAATEQAAAQRMFAMAPPVRTQIPTPAAGGFGELQQGIVGVSEATEGLSGRMASLMTHMGRIGMYALVYEALRIGIEQVSHAYQVLVPSVNNYTNLMQMVSVTNENAAATFKDLQAAAFNTNTTQGETQQRMMAFVAAGSSFQKAAQQAGAMQIEIGQSGNDLTEAFTRAQQQGSTLADRFKVGATPSVYAEHPEILRHAQEDQLFQNRLKYRENDMQKAQHDRRLEFEDEKRNQNELREDRQELKAADLQDKQRTEDWSMEAAHRNTRQQMEDHRTVIEDNLEDTQHAEDVAMEKRHTGMEREMEDRHMALSREMEDRHKAESRAQQDAQAAHQERLAIAGAVGGAEQAVAEGRGVVMGQIGKKRVRVSIPASVMATIQAEQEEGYAELERQGISRSVAQYMIRAHVMSPGALTQAAEAARKRKADEEDRKRDDEAQKQERAFADESRDMGRKEHDEQVAMVEMHYEQRTQSSRDLRDEERVSNRQMENEQIEQTHRQTIDSRDQSRTFHAENQGAVRENDREQRSMDRGQYEESQGLKDEGLDREKRGNDELNSLQQERLDSYNKAVGEKGGIMGEVGRGLGGVPKMPYVHEKSMFEHGQALKTKDDSVHRDLMELLKIFRS